MTECNLSIWGDIANIVIAVASIATAIVTANVLRKQHKLQKEQLNAQQLEHQPLFSFGKTTDDYLTISNNGYALTSPATITLQPLLMVAFDRIANNSSEVLDSYFWSMEIIRYSGRTYTANQDGLLIRYKKLSEDTEKLLQEKITEIRQRVKKYEVIYNLSSIEIRTTNLIKIEYVDMYKVSRTTYFWERTEIASALYDQIKNTIYNQKASLIADIDITAALHDIMRLKHKI